MQAACLTCCVALSTAPAFAAQPIADSDLTAQGMSRYWGASLPLPEGDLVADIYAVDDTVYVTTEGGLLYSVRADAGLIRWVEQVSTPNIPISKPQHVWTPQGNGPVSVYAGQKLQIIDRYAGLRLDEVDLTGFSLTSNPIGALRSFFFSTMDQMAYSYRFDLDGRFRKRWEVHTYGISEATPVLFGNRQILLTNLNGLVVACSAIDKSLSWHFKTAGAITGDPAVDDSGVYVASQDRSLYKIDGRNGKQIWRVRFGSTLIQGPAVTPNSAYQYCTEEGLSAVDVTTGKKLWNRKDATRLLAESGGHAVLTIGDSQIAFVEIVSGNETGVVDLVAPSVFATNTQNDAVYLSTTDGHVLCTRPIGVPYLRASDGEQAAVSLNTAPATGTDVEKAEKPGKTPEVSTTRSSDYFRSRKDR